MRPPRPPRSRLPHAARRSPNPALLVLSRSAACLPAYRVTDLSVYWLLSPSARMGVPSVQGLFCSLGHLINTCRMNERHTAQFMGDAAARSAPTSASPPGLCTWFNFLNSTTWKKMCSRMCLASCWSFGSLLVTPRMSPHFLT